MADRNQKPRSPRRRAFLTGSVAAVGTLGSVGPAGAHGSQEPGATSQTVPGERMAAPTRARP